jgi:hypothetical protein
LWLPWLLPLILLLATILLGGSDLASSFVFREP